MSHLSHLFRFLFVLTLVCSSTFAGNKDKAKQKLINSIENKNGNLLKIILGTRSIMEGVSFKNVKQVHITDPWWNESRIEQILARAVRFCSHSLLPLDEQWTDIFRHYSALPMNDDPEISEMLKGLHFHSFIMLHVRHVARGDPNGDAQRPNSHVCLL